MKLNITIPVCNEERRMEAGVRQLAAFLASEARTWDYELVIADNGSTDRTPALACQLAGEIPRLRVERIQRRGRGGALRQVWLGSESEVLSYMDVDMAADLRALPALVSAVADGRADLAIGSRSLRPETTQRSWQRSVLSRGYNRLLRTALGMRCSDAQCGFKVLSRRAAQALVPLVEDEEWFFDTELLLLAERSGYRILDWPVAWQENRDSTVKILSTIHKDLLGVARLRRHSATGASPAVAANLSTPAKP